MPFDHNAIAAHAVLIEKLFWSKHRPRLGLRDRMREGQRIEGSTIELFYVRPAFNRPQEWIEEPIARLRHFPRLGVWRIYWQRADLRWHLYQPQPEFPDLADCLRVVSNDEYHCFFG